MWFVAAGAAIRWSPLTLALTEATNCNPRNLYERTKYEAEMLVSNSNIDMNICILRPTNVVSYTMPGILSSCVHNSWRHKIKFYLKGRENAHIVYAKDVASAAMFFMNNSKSETNTYLVSRDDDEKNTYAGIYNMYQYINCNNNNLKFSLPIFIPNMLRKIFKGDSLHGHVRFSNDKLKNTGFVFKYNVEECLRDICR